MVIIFHQIFLENIIMIANTTVEISDDDLDLRKMI